MRLTLTTVTGDVYTLDVSADIELENLKVAIMNTGPFTIETHYVNVQ